MIKTKIIVLALSIFILQCSKEEVKLNTIKIKIEFPTSTTLIPNHPKNTNHFLSQMESKNDAKLACSVKTDDIKIKFLYNTSELIRGIIKIHFFLVLFNHNFFDIICKVSYTFQVSLDKNLFWSQDGSSGSVLLF